MSDSEEIDRLKAEKEVPKRAHSAKMLHKAARSKELANEKGGSLKDYYTQVQKEYAVIPFLFA